MATSATLAHSDYTLDARTTWFWLLPITSILRTLGCRPHYTAPPAAPARDPIRVLLGAARFPAYYASVFTFQRLTPARHACLQRYSPNLRTAVTMCRFIITRTAISVFQRGMTHITGKHVTTRTTITARRTVSADAGNALCLKTTRPSAWRYADI